MCSHLVSFNRDGLRLIQRREPRGTVLLFFQDRFGHANGLDGFRHIMRADDLRAGFNAQNRAGKRRWQAFIHRCAK